MYPHYTVRETLREEWNMRGSSRQSFGERLTLKQYLKRRTSVVYNAVERKKSQRNLGRNREEAKVEYKAL